MDCVMRLKLTIYFNEFGSYVANSLYVERAERASPPDLSSDYTAKSKEYINSWN